jgi:hypothetical protein
MKFLTLIFAVLFVSATIPVKKAQPYKTLFKSDYQIFEGETIDFGIGKVSWFGGPEDHKIAHSKVALYDIEAGNLNPESFYCALRFDSSIKRSRLKRAVVSITANYKTIEARLVDWGPHIRTGRIIDCSPGILKALNIETDDTARVEIYVPF